MGNVPPYYQRGNNPVGVEAGNMLKENKENS